MRIFGSGANLGVLAIGAGVALLAPLVIPVVAGILKPQTGFEGKEPIRWENPKRKESIGRSNFFRQLRKALQ